MNEKAKIFVVIGAIVAFFAIIIGYSIYFNYKSGQIYEAFEEKYNNKEAQIVLVGREGCGWCQLFKPILEFYGDKYDFSYEYIDTDVLASKDLNKIIEKLEVDASKFGTPLLGFVKDGKVLDTINGYVDERELLVILQEQGFIANEENLLANYLNNYEDIKNTFESKKKELVVVCQSSCQYCIMFKPVLMSIADEYGVKINYMNYNEIEEQEELGEYLSKYKEFQGDWGTPLTIVVENGKIINSFDGYTNEEEYVKFLKNNHLMEEK